MRLAGFGIFYPPTLPHLTPTALFVISSKKPPIIDIIPIKGCLLYTSDAADE